MSYKLYLASASPRRREILDMLGFEYELLLPSVDEDSDITDPAALVRELSSRKAQAAMELLCDEDKKNALILGADTVVYSGGKILGKPRDKADAREMLASLSGTTHEVYSGVSLVRFDGVSSESECTTVHFGAMTDAEIDAYVASGEPMDKAGAYAIQGLSSMWIDGIEGCNYNVIGLPVRRLYKMLCDLGIDPISLRRGAEIG